MRRILTCLTAATLSFAVVGPALAAPAVTNFQVRTYGVESWLTNMSDESPVGLYYDAYVQAYGPRTRDLGNRWTGLPSRITFPEWGTLDVASSDGLLTRYGIGDHEVVGPRE